MPQEQQQNTTYLVTVDAGTEGVETYRVTTSHLKTDAHFFPGFVQSFDENKQLVALAASSRVVLSAAAKPTRPRHARRQSRTGQPIQVRPGRSHRGHARARLPSPHAAEG
jgi:hypothetical protein